MIRKATVSKKRIEKKLSQQELQQDNGIKMINGLSNAPNSLSISQTSAAMHTTTPMIIEEPSVLESSKDSSHQMFGVKNGENLEDLIARTIEKQVEKSLSKLLNKHETVGRRGSRSIQGEEVKSKVERDMSVEDPEEVEFDHHHQSNITQSLNNRNNVIQPSLYMQPQMYMP